MIIRSAIASATQYSTSSTPGVLIINISNPESPSLVTYVTNDQNFDLDYMIHVTSP